ncbi:RNA polymerase sigma factor (sigma-70 family) [Kitasatospora sp. MAP12-15]|uniref:RNA polymerase sigma factor n=1 Tax=unclassified Kitasatospora TaxID=2633591 RepID=UPI00247313C0|nr:sigma-70 family RNA polymerase sigma factor [Kitasatospora sp. MAP12-44]MDH6110427.1 RNA polymerase sigma factor (sigma-70 family) [Kitasatospora sp. MAP12-44]
MLGRERSNGRERGHPPAGITGPEEFGAFYRDHVDAVLGFVTRRVADPQLAADLTADIFVAALEAADGYRPDRGAPIAWLYGIARNVIAGHARGRTREQGAVARLSGRRLLDDEDIAALEERIDAQQAVRALADRHAALSEPLRAVLDLVALDGLSTAETAQALGITHTTVRVRLHRARRLLGAPQTDPGPVPVPQLEVAR